MTALAASSDVVVVLGRSLTTLETAALAGALAAASAAVREVTGRKYEAGTYTVRRRVRDARVSLDAPATVTGVNRVNRDGTVTAVTGYTLRGDTVYAVGCGPWVEVTYTTAGTIPAEVVSVTAAMAARQLTITTPDGATSYTITKGPFAESASFDSPTEAVSPSASELKILRRYALPRPSALSLLR